MERNKREFNNISELLEALSPYISARALARIVGMGESQMLQYKAGIKKISPQNIARINEKLRNFAAELSEFTLKGA
jgi:signal recognition particle GTPase